MAGRELAVLCATLALLTPEETPRDCVSFKVHWKPLSESGVPQKQPPRGEFGGGRGMDTCVCMAESLQSPATITTLLLSYVSILNHFSPVRLCATPWTVACQAPLSIGFSRQEYWSGLSCPPPGDLPHPGIKPASLRSPALAGRFFTTSAIWESLISYTPL